jgi:two-component system, OmpR family, sensor histidine kinase KdpD
MTTELRRRDWSPALRGALVAIAAPGAVTLLAALRGGVSTTTAALAYVLAVVAAAVAGGVWSGLAASVASFIALNFFFTPEVQRFSVQKKQDLIAVGVFLAVSATVGTLVSRVITQRARAERREREARVLQNVGTRLLSGAPSDDVLRSLATSVTELFGLSRCEITTDLAATSIVVEGDRNLGPASNGGATEVIPLIARDHEIGQMVAVLGDGAGGLDPNERTVIQALASQTALAIDGMRLASEAQHARLEAETNSSRAALFSSVTHDLRTPLASITASVTSLLEPEARFGSEQRRDLLETIRQEAERLNRLVGNLLDLSRMRAGALTPSKAPAALDEVIEGVVGRLEPVLKEHDVKLLLEEDLPEIPLDVVQIDQALTNLLENSARFTPPGKRITVEAAQRRGGVEVRIEDEGPGIPAEARDRVFEPFVRGEGSTGTGLGLAIARAIVDAHQGRIRIVDASGGGTAVIIDLPGSAA